MRQIKNMSGINEIMKIIYATPDEHNLKHESEIIYVI